jgi:UDP-3-O-[3-hydroxymyristoyl] glucosamine N-acyltransferase
MKFSFSLKQLLECAGEYSLRGDGPERIEGIAALDKAGAGDLSFLGNSKYRSQVPGSKASVILLPLDYEENPQQKGQCYVLVENPSFVLAKICGWIEKQLRPRPEAGIHPSAVVAAGAQISSDAHIGPFCQIECDAIVERGAVLVGHNYVGRGAHIGEDCWIAPRAVVMDYCQLGKRVILQPGCVIGSDGYGYETRKGVHEKVPQIGAVILSDDVEIGANTTIDRARFDQTIIGPGTKLDNLVQIGHNVATGRGCLIVGQAGIAGSTKLGDYVIVGGQVGMAGHLNIGSGSKIASQSGVPGDLPPNSFVRGTPSEPYALEQRLLVLRRRLPEFFKRLSALEEKVHSLESQSTSSC